MRVHIDAVVTDDENLILGLNRLYWTPAIREAWAAHLRYRLLAATDYLLDDRDDVSYVRICVDLARGLQGASHGPRVTVSGADQQAAAALAAEVEEVCDRVYEDAQRDDFIDDELAAAAEAAQRAGRAEAAA